MAELNLEDLGIFLRVVDVGSFAGAARQLGVPTSTVSRSVTRLESAAGVRLLQRTTRSVRPTSEGRTLYGSAAPALEILRSATRALEPSTGKPRGRLRVTAPSDLCSSFLADVIAGFAEKHPLVQLDFTLTNQHSQLIHEGFDLALRATVSLGDSQLVARKLGDMKHGLYASPRYLERFGMPALPDDLYKHSCLVFRAKELVRTWTLRGPDGDSELQIEGRMGGDDFAFVRAMALAGAGIALLPQLNCAADQADRRLVRVLPQYHARGASLYVVIPSARHVPARVRAFRDYLVDAYAAAESRAKGPDALAK